MRDLDVNVVQCDSCPRWPIWRVYEDADVRKGFAVLLLLVGLDILSGADKRLEARVLQWLRESWVNLTGGF